MPHEETWLLFASMGAPKQKPKDKYFGRDACLASPPAFARKVETVVTITLTDADDGDSARRYTDFPRNGRVEDLYMGWSANGLVVVDRPPEKTDTNTDACRMGRAVLAALKPGDCDLLARVRAGSKVLPLEKASRYEGEVVYNRGAYFVSRRDERKPN